jgi:AraC family transcriptional regulator
VSPRLFRLRARLATATTDPIWRDEQVHAILQALFAMHRHVRQEVATLTALRPATRDEIYRRVYRAREYAAAFFHTAVTLDDMARVACLSPNHLLRSFQQVFHQSPHQFLIDCRLARARHLLTTTDASVTTICGAVGFSSLGSFSSLFRHRHGVAPTAYRVQQKR